MLKEQTKNSLLLRLLDKQESWDKLADASQAYIAIPSITGSLSLDNATQSILKS